MLLVQQGWALPQDPAELLFDVFGSKCKSQGRFTAVALNETRAIEGVLKTLVEQPECKGLSPVLSIAANLEDQLGGIEHQFSNAKNRDLHSYLERLSLYLTVTTSAEEQSYIAREIAETRVQILKSNIDEEERKRMMQMRASKQMSAYIDALSVAYPNLSLCFEKNKYLPLQLAGHLVSLSGGFAWDPIVHSALVLGGRLFSSVFSYFADRKFVSSIKKYRGAKLQASLSCALEALEDTVCDIRDHQKLVKVHRDYRNEVEIPLEWRGYDLFRRFYPRVQEFLKHVESGAEPTSQIQGQRRANLRQLEGNFRATKDLTRGLVSEAERKIELLKAAKQESDTVAVIVGLIDDISSRMGLSDWESGGDTNVYRSAFPPVEQKSRANIWLLTGKRDPDVSALHTQSQPYLIYYNEQVEKLKRVADIKSIKSNLEAIDEAAQVQLDIQKALVLNPDPLGTLTSWTERSLNLSSAGEVMDAIVQYLKALKVDWDKHDEWFADSYAKRDQLELLVNTTGKFTSALQVLRSDAPVSDRLKKILTVMNLEEQDQVITNRLKQIVQMDIEKRIRAGVFAEQRSLETSIRLASEDLLLGLDPGSAHFLNKVKADLDEAEILAKFNLKNFFDFFLSSLLRALEDLQSEAKQWNDYGSGPYSQKIAKFCILSLNAPQILQREFSSLRSFCKGRSLQAMSKGKPLVVDFDRSLQEFGNAPEERLCSYHEFRNQLDIDDLISETGSVFIKKMGLK